MTTKYPCFLGHYFLSDPDVPIITDLDNVTHIQTKCQRCGKIQILHLDNKKPVIK